MRYDSDNRMKNLIIIGLTIFVFYSTGFSQVRYSVKVEFGYLDFKNTTIEIEPGPNWKGFYLNDEQNGIDLNLINGITFKERIFAGVGLGYLNFEGIDGISIFGDFEYLPLKTKLTPLLNLKIGYNYIWNQYEGGTGTTLSEFSAGINYRLTEKLNIYFKSGFLFTQQSSLVPFRLGLRF